MPDQLRYDCIGANGNHYIHTPNIDRLSALGARFSNCYLQHSVCSQSRASMFTGKYPHVTGHRGLATLIKPYEDNLFKTLKNDGYHVVNVGTRGDLFSLGGYEESFDEYGFIVEADYAIMEKNRSLQKPSYQGIEVNWPRLYYTGNRGSDLKLDYDEALISSAEKWLKAVKKDPSLTDGKPWVLFLPLFFPHCPFEVESKWYNMYSRDNVPQRVKAETKTGTEPLYMAKLREKHGLTGLPEPVWNEVIATYHGMISRLDWQFGRILDLVEDDLKKDLYLFFFTDHGEYLGDHNLIEKWPSGVSEQLTHGPLFVSGPNLEKGRTIDHLVEMVDLVPTLFDLGKVETRYPNNGKSLVPLLHHQSTEDAVHKDYVIAEGGFLKSEEPIIEIAPYPYDIKANLQHDEIDTVGRVISMRTKEFTFVYRLYEPNELYSRTHDLQERHNLIDDPSYASVIDAFEKNMLRFFIESSDHAPFVSDIRIPEVNLPIPGSRAFKQK
ncbi:unnamed protein product [Kluyveromyces dobzhanskii CBS 2104]|uniref:WGS project CCBQ000000000 data, contig 00012 n=1 Tax=Kluyveromyces dobzhanskii CBS 2104 TaxID=1427455 RepID=A0A0A8L0U5_9SACH|nr:unnamed protein product [Kluyveromyces dobzhanskii CBS 2104]